METKENEGRCLPPAPGAMIEALRDIGYSLRSAVADVIDNSLSAKARRVDLRYGWEGDGAWIAIIDDGQGMQPSELIDAMRLGSKNPLDSRARDDLGRFGLGLKTASFSQCRQLTVVTRQAGQQSAWRWDLDEVMRRDEWMLLPLAGPELSALPCIELLGKDGTYVLWSKLDRLDLGSDSSQVQALMNSRISTVRQHLSLVFHRFLSGELGLKKVDIRINNAPLTPFDPFNARSLSGNVRPEEFIDIDGESVCIQAYTLPHHSMVSPEEYEKYAGEEGYLRNQGFYIYRNCRLIVYGTWFRLARQTELTKLARVKIDIPNTLDHLWTLDVRKSRAIPPEILRRRLKQIVDGICSDSKRPYVHRGTVIANRHTAPVWVRRFEKQGIKYEIDAHHPLIEEFRMDLEEDDRGRLDILIKMIGASFPAPLFFNDFANEPKKADQSQVDESLVSELLSLVALSNPSASNETLFELVSTIEPFASNLEATKRAIRAMGQES